MIERTVHEAISISNEIPDLEEMMRLDRIAEANYTLEVVLHRISTEYFIKLLETYYELLKMVSDYDRNVRAYSIEQVVEIYKNFIKQ